MLKIHQAPFSTLRFCDKSSGKPLQTVKDFRNEGLCHSTCKESWQAEVGEDKFSIKQVVEVHTHYEHQYDYRTGCRICTVIGYTYLFSHEYICI